MLYTNKALFLSVKTICSISASKCWKITVFSWVVSQMFPAILKPREIHNFSQGNGVCFMLSPVSGRWRFTADDESEAGSQRMWPSVNKTLIHFLLREHEFCWVTSDGLSSRFGCFTVNTTTPMTPRYFMTSSNHAFCFCCFEQQKWHTVRSLHCLHQAFIIQCLSLDTHFVVDASFYFSFCFGPLWTCRSAWQQMKCVKKEHHKYIN